MSIEQDHNLHKPIKRRVSPPTVIMRMEMYAAAYFEIVDCEASERWGKSRKMCATTRVVDIHDCSWGYL